MTTLQKEDKTVKASLKAGACTYKISITYVRQNNKNVVAFKNKSW